MYSTCILDVTTERQKCGEKTVDSQVAKYYPRVWSTLRKGFSGSGGTRGDLDFFLLLFLSFNFLSSKVTIYYLSNTHNTNKMSSYPILFALCNRPHFGVKKRGPAGCFRGPILGEVVTESPVGPNQRGCCFPGRRQRAPGAGYHFLALCPTYSRSQQDPRTC